MSLENYKKSLRSTAYLNLVSKGQENPDLATAIEAVEEVGTKDFTLGSDWEATISESNGGQRLSVSVGIVDGTHSLRDQRTLLDPKGRPRDIKVHIGDLRAQMSVQLAADASQQELVDQTARLKNTLLSYAQQFSQAVKAINSELAAELQQNISSENERFRQRQEKLQSLESETGMKFRDG